MPTFWDSLSLPWQVCLEEAWAAYRAGSIPIGAAVFAPDGALLARGRNRTSEPPGLPGLVSANPLAHAELNALVAVDLMALDPHPLALYTTTEPCPLCMGALYMSGVRACHYASRDPYAGSTNLLGTTPYLSRKPVRVFEPERSDLELLVMVAYMDFALRLFGERGSPVFDAICMIVPEAVAIGRRVAASDFLRRLSADGFPAEGAWNALAAFVIQTK